MRAGTFTSIFNRRSMLALLIAAGALALPAQAMALRYASPTGLDTNDCLTQATACDFKTAINGVAGNRPSDGEEVIVLPGSYTVNSEVDNWANNMYVHGVFDQPRPVIDQTAGQMHWSSGTLSYLDLENGNSGTININGGIGERLFLRGASSGDQPVCQCYNSLVRDSVVVSTGATAPALGINSNGGSANTTWRNVTAYTTSGTAPAVALIQVGAAGTLTANAFNVIAYNGGGSTDAFSDGPNSTLTLTNSNLDHTAQAQGGLIVPGGGNQTALPLFTDLAALDFSEQADSPTRDAGLTDPQNGDLDFAGNPRTVDGATDIGAYEYVPPAAVTPPRTPPAPSAPTVTLGRKKVKINKKGKGALGLTCTSASGGSCLVSGTLRATGKSKASSIGQVSGVVPSGTPSFVQVKLNKRGRSRLAQRGKLRVSLSGTVSAGASAPLSATLKLTPKR